jgi:hypothetical protein
MPILTGHQTWTRLAQQIFLLILKRQFAFSILGIKSQRLVLLQAVVACGLGPCFASFSQD